MNVFDWLTVENAIKFKKQIAWTDGVDNPRDYLWGYQNGIWQAMFEKYKKKGNEDRIIENKGGKEIQ